jgi:hypothetical protein
LYDGTLKFLILRYNQAIEKGIDLKDFFKSIETKKTNTPSNYISVFNKIAEGLAKGISPSVKDVALASKYFNEEPKIDNKVTSSQIIKISLSTLRQMVEWDSRMRILTNGERHYLAELAYELKPLNDFHKKNAEKHLQTLINSGLKLL